VGSVIHFNIKDAELILKVKSNKHTAFFEHFSDISLVLACLVSVSLYLNISPSTPAIFGFLKLNQMGASFSMVSNELVILLIEAIVYTILGYYFTNKKRKTICQNLKM
jgi:lipoprotein signal peptidase